MAACQGAKMKAVQKKFHRYLAKAMGGSMDVEVTDAMDFYSFFARKWPATADPGQRSLQM